MRTPFGLALFAALAGTVGCAAPCCDGPADLRIGGSDAEGLVYAPLLEGDRVPLLVGNQGGAHLHFHAQFEGLDPATLVLERRIEDVESESLIIVGRGPVDLVDLGEGRHELSRAVRMVVCPNSPPPEGRALRVTMTATDGGGRSVERTMEVEASCDGSRGCVAVCGAEPEP